MLADILTYLGLAAVAIVIAAGMHLLWEGWRDGKF